MEAQKRLGTLDFIRGITLISMIIYHGCWDLVNIYKIKVPVFSGLSGTIWQQSICITFILLSGICSSMGQNTLKKVRRGIIISLCGAVITAVTLVVMPDEPIYFGILTFTGFAMILFAITKPVLKKINPGEAIFFSVILFVFTKKASMHRLSLGYINPILPAGLYKNLFTAFLGFPPARFVSNDYFPVVPWIFMYAIGFYSGMILEKRDVLCKLKKPDNTVINFLGKHSLIIYMIHQPVIYGILYLILGRK